MCAATVGTWRRRFAQRRMDALYDEPRPDAPREIGGDEIAATIRKTPETVSEGGTHWSWRAMGSTETGHAPRRCSGTGALSACNRIGWRRSSCRPIRCWWRKCAISSGVAAGARRCAMRRREIAGTGARPRAAACADASGSGRPHDYTRHDLAVRGAGCEGRNHRRQVYASPSGERVSQMSRRGRAQCAGGSRRPYRHGQRRHPQDQADPRLVGQALALARSLHTKHQLAPRGSIRSSASSPCSPNEPCCAASSGPWPNSKRRSRRTSHPPTSIPNLSHEQRLPITEMPFARISARRLLPPNGLREALGIELPYLTRRLTCPTSAPVGQI